jgi:hypothetical protein
MYLLKVSDLIFVFLAFLPASMISARIGAVPLSVSELRGFLTHPILIRDSQSTKDVTSQDKLIEHLQRIERFIFHRL